VNSKIFAVAPGIPITVHCSPITLTMTLSFRKRLQKGGVLISSLLQMPLPEIAESFVRAGYDWLFIDLEHSPMKAHNALEYLKAVR